MDSELLTIIVGGGATILFWVLVRFALKSRKENKIGTAEQREYLDGQLRQYGLMIVPDETLESAVLRLDRAREAWSHNTSLATLKKLTNKE